jgi:hypothetical protein
MNSSAANDDLHMVAGYFEILRYECRVRLEAVYQKMLPEPRLRVLLTDDPGAGEASWRVYQIAEITRSGRTGAHSMQKDNGRALSDRRQALSLH